MGLLFVNGPVHNGEFTFATQPGKAVGIRLAAALNNILGRNTAPHLWNTASLEGDLRYARLTANGDSRSRTAIDAEWIARKYGPDPNSPVMTATDTDTSTIELGLAIIERQLQDGALYIREENVKVCSRCRHMLGSIHYPCKRCGDDRATAGTERHLVYTRSPNRDLLNLHACRRRPPMQVLANARNAPRTIILSRTRNHGIPLDSFGLPGLVLDPRAGLHVTALATALAYNISTVVMTITSNALMNISTHGEIFSKHEDILLRYAVHGKMPCAEAALLKSAEPAKQSTQEHWRTFEEWFLPLVTLKEKNGIPAKQLPALLAYYRKARNVRSRVCEADYLAEVRRQVSIGDTTWIDDRRLLASAMSTIT